jgi:hypothetical protein
MFLRGANIKQWQWALAGFGRFWPVLAELHACGDVCGLKFPQKLTCLINWDVLPEKTMSAIEISDIAPLI